MISLLVFISSASLISLAAALLVGNLSPNLSFISLLIATIVAWWARESANSMNSGSSTSESFMSSAWKKILNEAFISKFLFFITMLGFGVIGYVHFSYLYYFRGNGLWSLNPNNLGDLPLHINMIKGLGRGASYWPDNFILSGFPLKYPFGMDHFNALWESLGFNTQFHLFFVGFACFILTLFFLFRWMSYWGVSAFFLSGGFLNWENLIQGNSWTPGDSVSWKNLFLSVFVTQRGFLFALPAGIFLLMEFMNIFENKKDSFKFKDYSWKKYFQWICIWGGLAFFHLHTFFIVSFFLLGLLCLKQEWSWKNKFQFFQWTFLPTGLVALPFLFISLFWGGNKDFGGGLIHLSRFWTWNGQTSLFSYLLINFGVWLFVFLGFLAWIIWNRKKLKTPFFFHCWAYALFIVFCFLILAPWDWDQIKILLWLYLIICSYFFKEILFEKNVEFQFWVCILVFYPGVFHLSRSMPAYGKAVQLQGVELISEVNEIAYLLSPTEVVAVSPNYNHPLFFIGQKVLHGYLGHVWSHGYNSQERMNDLKSLMKGEANWKEIMVKLNVSWIYWGEEEKKEYGADEKLWMKDLLLVYNSPNVRLYKRANF